MSRRAFLAVSRRAAFLAALLLLAGCSRDRKPLDQFSRAYTGFRDASAATGRAVSMSIRGDSEYRRAVTTAMDPRASDEDRSLAAGLAIGSDGARSDRVAMVLSRTLDSMSTAVSSLRESASRIENKRARSQAVEIAQDADRMRAALAALVPLEQERSRIQLDVLEDLIARRGAFTELSVANLRKLRALAIQSDAKWRNALDHWKRAQDGFRAMRDQFGLVRHPGRFDSDSTAFPTHLRR